MLQRIRASRWVRTGLLVVILACCGYALVAEWPQVHPALGRLHWYSVAGAGAAALAGSACMMVAWQRVLADLGSPLPIPVAARVTFVAQLGKYVPGGVWSLAAHVELGHDYDVPRRRGAASVVIGLAVAVSAGLLIAAASLPLASPAVARKYLIFLLAIPLIAVCLYPPVLHRLLNLALKIIRQEPLEQALSWRGLGSALGWTMVGFLLFGLQVWMLLADVASGGVHLLLIAIGAYALACSLALMLVVFPNGIGAREVIMVAALAPVLPHGAAVAVALVTRLVTTVSDLTWGGIALGLARSDRRAIVAQAAGGGGVAPTLPIGTQVSATRRRAGHRKAHGRHSPAAPADGQPSSEQGSSAPLPRAVV